MHNVSLRVNAHVSKSWVWEYFYLVCDKKESLISSSLSLKHCKALSLYWNCTSTTSEAGKTKLKTFKIKIVANMLSFA